MHFVNWQRDVSVEERDGRKVVVKRNKTTKEFHEFLISYVYTLLSLLLARPARPVHIGMIAANEGQAMRSILEKLDIPTPELFYAGEEYVVEEFVEGGNLYRAFARSGASSLAFEAGALTGRLHRAGYVFVDNKVQNYLVKGDQIVRTDLGFTQKTSSLFSKSMDIGSFLASVIDLPKYAEIEEAFYRGYAAETRRKFSYLAIILRNLLSLGLSSNGKTMLQNMIRDTKALVEL